MSKNYRQRDHLVQMTLQRTNKSELEIAKDVRTALITLKNRKVTV